LAELASFGRYLGRILASEYQADVLGLQDVKVVLKRLLAKRVDLIQTAGVDKYSVYAVGFVLQDIKELASRSAVKITLHDQIQPVAVLANRDFEIRRYDISFFRAIWY
jgi:hypothetical protein